MAFSTSFEIAFETARAKRDAQEIERALEAVARKAEASGRRIDRALRRGVSPQARANFRGVSRDLDRATVSARSLDATIRRTTVSSGQLATSTRATAAAQRGAALQAAATAGATGVAAASSGAGALAAGGGAAAVATARSNTASLAGVAAAARLAQASLLGFLGAFAGFHVVSRATKQAVAVGDEIAKTARRIGVTSESLQELRVVAGLGGVSVGQLDSALEAMVNRIGEARVNTGTLVTFLERFDPVLLENVKSATDAKEQLLLVADAFEKIPDPANRAALAAAFFGRGAGSAMVNVMIQGRKAIAELAREARNLGLVIDEELLTESERLNDQFALMSQVVSVNLTRAMLGLGPLIEATSKRMAELAIGVGAVFDSFKEQDSRATFFLEADLGKLQQRIEKIKAAGGTEGLLGKGLDLVGGQVGPLRSVGSLEAEAKGIREILAARKAEADATAKARTDAITAAAKLGGAAPDEAATDKLAATLARLKTEQISAEREITAATLTEFEARRQALRDTLADNLDAVRGNAAAEAQARATFDAQERALVATTISELEATRVAAEERVSQATLTESERRIKAIQKERDEIVAAAQDSAELRAAAEASATAQLEVERSKLRDRVISEATARRRQAREFVEVEAIVQAAIKSRTIELDEGIAVLEKYGRGLDDLGDRADAVSTRLESVGATLSQDVLGALSGSIVSGDLFTGNTDELVDRLLAANERYLTGVLEESLRPALGSIFGALSGLAGGKDTTVGAIFKGAQEEAVGGVGATAGERLQLDATERLRTTLETGSNEIVGAIQAQTRALGDGAGTGQVTEAIVTSDTRQAAQTREATAASRDDTETLGGALSALGGTLLGALERLGTGLASTIRTLANFVQGGEIDLVGAAASITGQLGQALSRSGTTSTAGDGGSVTGDFGAGFGTESSNIAHRGGVVGRTAFTRIAVPAGTFASAKRYAQGGLTSDEVPIIAHRGELIAPLEGGRLVVNMQPGGGAMVRTPSGARVPVAFEGARRFRSGGLVMGGGPVAVPADDRRRGGGGSPVVFAAGAIVVQAAPGERLDQTAGQAVRRAFAEGARQSRRDTGE